MANNEVERLAGFNTDRSAIVADVCRRVVAHYRRLAIGGGEGGLEYVLNEAAFSEIRRLENERGRRKSRQLERWRDLAHHVGRMSESEKTEQITALVNHYALDIVGNFNPRVYRLANEILAPGLSFLFSPVASLKDGLSAVSQLKGRVQRVGAVDHARRVAELGTVVVTPTHSSNLDSVAVGFGLAQAGMPAVTYGAGKNLFTNPFISYFMHNLGAYRVDRRLRFDLYKQVLKEYSTVLLEWGYHSLFFPGGTRCRSNRIEDRLKLGLLGTTVQAYENNVRAGRADQRIFIVPVTINYRLVLEAETLIDDYLAETGKSRYIIQDDEFSRLGRMTEFFRKILSHEGSVVLGFGTPRDPFGNLVDEDGMSLDARGRRVDPASYIMGRGDQIENDLQRNHEYTRRLGEKIAEDYKRDTVLLSPHIVARALFDVLCARYGTRDIYRLLRITQNGAFVQRDEVIARVELLRAYFPAAVEEGGVCGHAHGRIYGAHAQLDTRAFIDDALRALSTYHTRAVASWSETGESIQIDSLKLLFYYQNRLDHVSDYG